MRRAAFTASTRLQVKDGRRVCRRKSARLWSKQRATAAALWALTSAKAAVVEKILPALPVAASYASSARSHMRAPSSPEMSSGSP